MAEERKVLKNMTWPPQSPDCNPIELLWDKLNKEARKPAPKQCKTAMGNIAK